MNAVQPIGIILSLLLLGSSSLLYAQPPAHAGARGGSHNEQSIPQSQQRTDRHTEHRHQQQATQLDERIIRNIFREQRHLLSPAPDALPPGIRKNLARGKPLPPGIAKQFDNRLIGQLPRYPDYDWRQVGRDAILVGVTTGVVEAILENIYD